MLLEIQNVAQDKNVQIGNLDTIHSANTDKTDSEHRLRKLITPFAPFSENGGTPKIIQGFAKRALFPDEA